MGQFRLRKKFRTKDKSPHGSGISDDASDDENGAGKQRAAEFRPKTLLGQSREQFQEDDSRTELEYKTEGKQWNWIVD